MNSKPTIKSSRFANVIVNLLSGLSASFLSSLLIYFKQKELFHHGLVLFTVFAVYVISSLLRKRLHNITAKIKFTCLVMFIIFCTLGPQIIYQIRPFTFYISGLVMGMILVISSSALLLNSSNKFYAYFLFLAGYFVGFLLSALQIHFVLLGFLMVIIIYYLLSGQLEKIYKYFTVAFFLMATTIYWYASVPINYFIEQADYEDKVIFTSETQHHKLVITQWQQDNWFFIDKLKNISSIDEYLYYEPMTHAVFRIANSINNVLVIGGENGCLIREALKYKYVKSIEVVRYDSVLLNLGMTNPYYIEMNKNAFANSKVKIIQENLLRFISNTNHKYDAIFVDLPDPRSIETNQYYTQEFYNLLRNLLADKGVMITQAGSPYFASDAFFSIGATIREAGFSVLPIHNQILTLGEWGWYIGTIDQTPENMLNKLLEEVELPIETRWFNQEAAALISAFGKTDSYKLQAKINSLENPVVYRYYLKGNWDMR